MNIIQTIRSWFFGKEEPIETPEDSVVEKQSLVDITITYVTKEEVAAMVKHQESAPKPKPKRKYTKKKQSDGEAK